MGGRADRPPPGGRRPSVLLLAAVGLTLLAGSGHILRHTQLAPAGLVALRTPDRVAVCVAGQLRNMTETGESIRRRVIGPLAADVFVHAPMNADWANWRKLGNVTRIVLEGNEPDAVALFQSSPAYGELVGGWMGNFIAPADGRPGGCLYQYRSRSKCMDLVEEAEAQAGMRYSRVVFVRPDMKFLVDMPPLHLLDRRRTWIPTGEDYGGINDRGAIVARDHADVYFRLWELLFSEDILAQLEKHPDKAADLNAESFLWMALEDRGVKVGRYWGVAAIVCCNAEGCNCSHTTCADGQKYKYPSEIATAKATATALGRGKGWRWLGAIRPGPNRAAQL